MFFVSSAVLWANSSDRAKTIFYTPTKTVYTLGVL